MPGKLIMNADDFGASPAVNRAVLRAHREGVLTSASLMVTGGAVDEAVCIARDTPTLAVGLHLTLTQTRSVLPREAVPNLVDSASRFRSNDIHAALRCYLDSRAKRQLRREIEAQFEAFASHGIRMSHVDGHQHMHCLVPVLRIVTELAPRYGAAGIRVPREPLAANLRLDRSRPGHKLATAVGLVHSAIARRVALRCSRLVICDRAVGSYMTGRMSEDYVIGMLGGVGSGATEVYFHPSDEDSGDPFGPNTGDLRTLLSPRLREFISMSGFDLTTYPGLAGRAEATRERR